jgi:hypothetical protein
MSLPGDEIAPSPGMASTRAIAIQAQPEEVWRWLVQIGQGRGGLFSYDWLENLVGSDIHTLREIRPELQHLAAGDEVRMGPEGYPFFRVVDVEPRQALVLQAADPKTGAAGTGKLVLRPAAPGPPHAPRDAAAQPVRADGGKFRPVAGRYRAGQLCHGAKDVAHAQRAGRRASGSCLAVPERQSQSVATRPRQSSACLSARDRPSRHSSCGVRGFCAGLPAWSGRQQTPDCNHRESGASVESGCCPTRIAEVGLRELAPSPGSVVQSEAMHNFRGDPCRFDYSRPT